MIKYSLKCNKCLCEFDSWFGSSHEYDRLLKLKYLNCENCGSLDVQKSLMTPNIFNAKKNKSLKNEKKHNNVKKKLREYQKFIKNNFEYVGDNFTYEARSIHYNKKRNKKNIYGNATLDEVKELKEEGIDTEMIPWIEDKEN